MVVITSKSRCDGRSGRFKRADKGWSAPASHSTGTAMKISCDFAHVSTPRTTIFPSSIISGSTEGEKGQTTSVPQLMNYKDSLSLSFSSPCQRTGADSASVGAAGQRSRRHPWLDHGARPARRDQTEWHLRSEVEQPPPRQVAHGGEDAKGLAVINRGRR